MSPSLDRFLELVQLIKIHVIFLLNLIAFLAWTVAVAAAEFHDIVHATCFLSALIVGIVLYFSYRLFTFACF